MDEQGRGARSARGDELLDVTVVGGGISGLTTGFLLRQRGYRVQVLEATDSPGGCIRTWDHEGFRFELGPSTVLDNAPEIGALFREAGLAEDRLTARPESKKRFVVKGGRLVPLPGGPPGFVRTPLFSWRAKLRLLREPFIRRAPAETEESIAEFTRRRLGSEFLDYAVGPFVSGVYAGDPARLSVRWATVKIHALEERYGSLIRGAIAKRKGPAPGGGIFSFPGGLGDLPERLASRLEDDWRPRCRVDSVEESEDGYRLRADGAQGPAEIRSRVVVTAVPSDTAGSILSPLGGEFPTRIGTLPYADVAVIALGFRRESVGHPLDGFGFLAPEVEGRHALGCLFPSSLFPDRAPAGHVALSAFVGGAMHPERVEGPEDEILRATLSDIGPLLDIRGDPVVSRVEVWKPAIPQYVVGHGSLVEACERFESDHPGVFISGNLLRGVSVADGIRRATEVAQRVADHLESGREERVTDGGR